MSRRKISGGRRTQRGRGEIKLSQARSLRARRDHVSNRNCHRGNFRAYKETPVLDRKLAFRGSRLRLSRPRRDRSLTCVALLVDGLHRQNIR